MICYTVLIDCRQFSKLSHMLCVLVNLKLKIHSTRHVGVCGADETYTAEHARGEQTLISDAVHSLPHLEGHAALPPSAVLLFAYDATLRERTRFETIACDVLRSLSDQSEWRIL